MLRVLLAEDERYVRKSIVNRVAWEKINAELCMEAETGSQTLDAVRSLHPDVLITDIRMPCMDGLQVLETLRGEGNQITCIIISGYGDFSYAQKAIRLGVCDYLTKPVDIAKLTDQLNRLAEKNLMRPFNGVDEVDTDALTDQMDKIHNYIQTHYREQISGKQLSEQFYLSPAHLSHTYKQRYGVGISQYLETLRVERAKELLCAGRRTKDVAYAVGYTDESYFIRVFKRRIGVSPMRFLADFVSDQYINPNVK